MASKDPAFLFYPKDWLQGTAEMTPEEKGVYIDLLAHQHQRGGLPTETKRLSKMVGLSEPDFLKIWQLLKTKFNQSDNRLVNQKLYELTTDRLSKSHTNKITGKFATLIRSINHLSKDIVETLKKEFKITDFDRLPTERATERLTEWFYSRLESIGNGNVFNNLSNDYNQILNIVKSNNINGGHFEKNYHDVFQEMIKIYKIAFPAYFDDFEADYSACVSIIQKTEKLKIWPAGSVLNGHLDDFLAFWTEIVEYVAGDKWLSTRSLKDLSNREWQRLGQHMSKPPKERIKKVSKYEKKSEYEKQLEAQREAARNKTID